MEIKSKTYAGNLESSFSVSFLLFPALNAAKRSFRFKAAASSDPTSADIVDISQSVHLEWRNSLFKISFERSSRCGSDVYLSTNKIRVEFDIYGQNLREKAYFCLEEIFLITILVTL